MKVWVLNYFSMITNLICSRYIIEIFPFCISLLGILKNKIKSLYCASCTIALPFGFHIATFFLFFLVRLKSNFPVVLFVHFNIIEGGDQTSKNLEAHCGGN